MRTYLIWYTSDGFDSLYYSVEASSEQAAMDMFFAATGYAETNIFRIGSKG